ncbi:uncharacterized protein A4U43_C04F28140 [Asparagus officinalis]|uniref:Uncharacterized protein n=1 Tax=Asparagus officinalis TaxID=4686 RepID=A0A5P1F4Z2_ASPOF|nr:uncharacterized protein A4U43_C04F28140 [Asparagus officinalis]
MARKKDRGLRVPRFLELRRMRSRGRAFRWMEVEERRAPELRVIRLKSQLRRRSIVEQLEEGEKDYVRSHEYKFCMRKIKEEET